jgi:very-short-patch-repair endonuclease
MEAGARRTECFSFSRAEGAGEGGAKRRMRAGLRSKPEPRKLPSMSYTPRKSLGRARSLRREQTEAEKSLWGCLRGRRLNGHKFVRQEPICPFIADFLCRKRKLIVEVDGATHSESEEIAYDERRSKYLQALGYEILRVQNADIFTIRDDVLDMILMALEKEL